jgi:hypothetical protein
MGSLSSRLDRVERQLPSIGCDVCSEWPDTDALIDQEQTAENPWQRGTTRGRSRFYCPRCGRQPTPLSTLVMQEARAESA